MDILTWIIFGAIAGWITTSFIVRENSGCLTNILIGIAGSIIGGLLFKYFGGQGITGFNIYSLFVAIIGSIVLLVIVNLARR